MEKFNEIFNLTDEQEKPHKGSLLIAKPTMDDAYFKRSVIVMVNHDDNESMGLIVNNKTEFTLNEAVPGITCDEDIPLFLGGPVHKESLFYIHTLGPDIIPNAHHIGNGLYIGGDYNVMKEYVNSGAPIDGVVKFLVGYSGWGPGQLGSEITLHSWAVSNNLDVDLVMQDEEIEIWRGAVANFGDRYRRWLQWPSSILLN